MRLLASIIAGGVAGWAVATLRLERHMRKIPQELRTLEFQLVGGGLSIEQTIERTMEHLRTYYRGGEVKSHARTSG